MNTLSSIVVPFFSYEMYPYSQGLLSPLQLKTEDFEERDTYKHIAYSASVI